MTNPTPVKKTIHKKLTDLTIRLFEQLSKTKATDKVKRSLSKTSKKASRTVHTLLKKDTKQRAKKAEKEKKALAKKSKKSVAKKP